MQAYSIPKISILFCIKQDDEGGKSVFAVSLHANTKVIIVVKRKKKTLSL
jgi:hypothetical protein